MVPRGPVLPCGVQSPSGHVNSTTARNLRQIGRSDRRRGTHGRYTDTDGSPSSQNRHGTVAAALTPTLGPVQIAFSATEPILVLSRTGEAGSQKSAPLKARSIPSA